VYKGEFPNLWKDFLRHMHVHILMRQSFAFYRWVYDVRIDMFYFVIDHVNAKQTINVQDFLHLNEILKQKKEFAEIFNEKISLTFSINKIFKF
jgi:hypothetical protein